MPGIKASGTVVLVLAVAVLAAGCSQAQSLLAQPFVGEVQDCTPHIEAALCHRIAEAAVFSIKGPAVSADGLSVSEWDSCQNEQLVAFAPGAAQGKVCYVVMGSGYAGGERIAPNTYRNGTPVDIEAAVWTDNQGNLHAAAKSTPTELVPAQP
jgi:hypothetical protein